MAGYRTDLGRARGLGSAKHGVGHWISERVTSAALVPLAIWAVYSGLVLSAGGYADAVRWTHSPLNAVLLILLIGVGVWHMQVGMRVIVEDYVSGSLNRAVLLILNLFICVLAGGIGIFSVLKVALTSQGA